MVSSEVHCLLSFPNHPTLSMVYRDVAMTGITASPSYVTAYEVVTSFTSGTEEPEEGDNMHQVLPFEANEMGQEGTKDDEQKM